MNTKKLKELVLDLAIHGKLVPQDPNDEPASVLLARIQTEKAKTAKGKKATTTEPIDEVPFEVPEGWVWTTIGGVGDVVTGNTPAKERTDFYGGSIPFYKPTDLEQGVNTTISSDTLSELGFENARQLPVNSVLVTCIGATIGKTGVIRMSGSCNQQINAIIPYGCVLSNFCYYVVISDYFQNEIKDNANATTLPILNKSSFSELKLPLPPLAEQQRIVAKIEQIFGELDKIKELANV